MQGPCSPTALVCLLQQRKESVPSSPPTAAPSSTSLRKSGPTSERKGRPEREAANNGYNDFPFPRLHFLVSLSSAQVQVYGRERCGRRGDSSAVVNPLARESECRRARLPSASVHVGMQKPQRRSYSVNPAESAFSCNTSVQRTKASLNNAGKKPQNGTCALRACVSFKSDRSCASRIAAVPRFLRN
ncbi:hypothetical protein HPB51_022551 [Rhipicephalus microplus]|uniref:Uncharacterized protein n=1 Tax=Rhipicephalus microplus TaxID=6941 RepID=A0A9J6DD09_RHIMP|nr:hypothetical protein HPB51_022551 [Rhipicephalus microplus]